MSSKSPRYIVKRGDDFRLDMTIQDHNNDTALAAKIVVDAAQEAYDLALAADPLVALDVSTTHAALVAAQTDYADAIIVDITTWTITSKMAWCGRLISTFNVVILDAPNGVFSLRLASADTSLWKPRLHEADVQFVRTEGKVSSETFEILVIKDVTNG